MDSLQTVNPMEPYHFSLPIQRFDVQLLPPEARAIGSDAFKSAVTMYFAAQYLAKGETAIVTVDDKDIHVISFPANMDSGEFVQNLLQSGRIQEALPFLQQRLDLPRR